jgi:nicotinamidase/pyrazinamidase
MKALVITDVQNDFLPGGALAVKNSHEIIPIINNLIEHFDHVIATQDWLPPNHVSFAKTFNKSVGDIIELNGIKQILWPVHCVQGSFGAALSDDLNQSKVEYKVFKGTDPNVDSYSVFFDNAKLKSTNLEQYLTEHDLNDLYFVGLTTDYCVKYSALDALELGFQTTIIKDACKAISLHPKDEEKALFEMQNAGAKVTFSKNLL